MFAVSVVLSDRGLCDELITRPEKSCRLRCDVYDPETSKMRTPCPALGRSTPSEEIVNQETAETVNS